MLSGVTVGHTTLISGEGKLVVGKGPVRTGVTAVFPRGKDCDDPLVFRGLVVAEWQWRNDRNDLGGRIRDFSTGPVMITNTHSVGVVRDAVIQWTVAHRKVGSG